MRRKKEPFITVNIKDREYNDFRDLYETNQPEIYQGVLDIYNELRNSRKKSLMLLVTTNMNNIIWDTEFIFNKDECSILMDQLLPYYEDNEDYEKCIEIKKLYEHFSNK